jgi:hypothetical protein
VENIFLNVASCPDGDYQFFVRYYSNDEDDDAQQLWEDFDKAPAIYFTFVCNQLGLKIDEGSSVAETVNEGGSNGSMDEDADTHCLTLTMKNKKVSKAKFHVKTKKIPV